MGLQRRESDTIQNLSKPMRLKRQTQRGAQTGQAQRGEHLEIAALRTHRDEARQSRPNEAAPMEPTRLRCAAETTDDVQVR